MAELCHCGSAIRRHRPDYESGDLEGWDECRGCKRNATRCKCPVFCAGCQKPLFHGEANPCCKPAAASEVAHA